MKFKYFLILLLIVIIGFVVGRYSEVILQMQQDSIARLEEAALKLQETNTPVRFRIERRSDDSVYVLLKLMKADKTEISKTHTQLIGNELFIDFISVPVGNRVLAFPYRMFTDHMAPDSGVDLFPLYLVDDLPLIYMQDSVDFPTRDILRDLVRHIRDRGANATENSFGTAIHDIKQFKSFQTGITYEIITHTRGGIEIIETK